MKVEKVETVGSQVGVAVLSRLDFTAARNAVALGDRRRGSPGWLYGRLDFGNASGPNLCQIDRVSGMAGMASIVHGRAGVESFSRWHLELGVHLPSLSKGDEGWTCWGCSTRLEKGGGVLWTEGGLRLISVDGVARGGCFFMKECAFSFNPLPYNESHSWHASCSL